jgi:hypothetical protein
LYDFYADRKSKMAATAIHRYSLALIIFVVSEKKAFEHFPIGPMLIYFLQWRPSWISNRHK